jgi:glycosyltransferase A (GT-A) superfamily protein (DUF2064 family)
VTPDEAAISARGWPRGPERLPQGGGDLGARMGRVLARSSPDRPVVIVGSDIPDLDRHHVAAAFAALGGVDLVFGPATDGGFWLVGASAPPPAGLFDGVRWSTAHALADTLANAGRRARVLSDHRLEDLDDWESWRRFRARDGLQR